MSPLLRSGRGLGSEERLGENAISCDKLACLGRFTPLRGDFVFEEALNPLLGDSADPVAAGWQLRQLAESASGHGGQLVHELSERANRLGGSDPAIVGGLLRVVHTVLLDSGGDWARRVSPGQLRAIEASLPPQAPNRHLILQLYAMIRSEESLQILADSLETAPPSDWVQAAQVLSPLMQHDDWPVDAFYPQIFRLPSVSGTRGAAPGPGQLPVPPAAGRSASATFPAMDRFGGRQFGPDTRRSPNVQERRHEVDQVPRLIRDRSRFRLQTLGPMNDQRR